VRFLLDQGLARSTADLLTQRGHDAVHVGAIGLGDSTDEAIVAQARSEAQVVVTLDADFHALISLSGATLPSVVRIRVEGLKAEATALLIAHLASAHARDLENGCLVTVTPGRVRIRRLPIGGG